MQFKLQYQSVIVFLIKIYFHNSFLLIIERSDDVLSSADAKTAVGLVRAAAATCGKLHKLYKE